MPNHRGITPEQEIKAIELYKTGRSLHSIAKEFNVNWSPIWTCLKRNNIPRRKTYHFSRKYRVDETYFEKIDSHEKAYFLGFIMADGYVRDNKKSQYFIISIQKDDREILDRMQISMKSEHPIRIVKSRINWKKGYISKEQACFRVGSIKMCQDLIKLGCTTKKSLTMEWPNNLSEEFVNSFVLGYFDGDGSISNTTSNGYTKYTLDFSSSLTFCEQLRQLIMHKFNFNVNLSKLRNKHIYGRIFVHNYDNIIALKNWMYKDAKHLSLFRKRNRFDFMESDKRVLFKKYE